MNTFQGLNRDSNRTSFKSGFVAIVGRRMSQIDVNESCHRSENRHYVRQATDYAEQNPRSLYDGGYANRISDTPGIISANRSWATI